MLWLKLSSQSLFGVKFTPRCVSNSQIASLISDPFVGMFVNWFWVNHSNKIFSNSMIFSNYIFLPELPTDAMFFILCYFSIELKMLTRVFPQITTVLVITFSASYFLKTSNFSVKERAFSLLKIVNSLFTPITVQRIIKGLDFTQCPFGKFIGTEVSKPWNGVVLRQVIVK